MPRLPSRTKPVPIVLSSGPYRGVRDTTAPGAASPDLAQDARNVFRRPGPQGVGFLSRPGFAVMDALNLGTAVQAVTTWTNASGVRQTTAVIDGTLWAYDWSADSWTEVVTAANLVTASVTLATTGRVSLVPFAGKLMVSDGVNALVTWDGTTGAGGVTQIADVGPFYGPLRVYYAKLFGILAGDAGAGPRKTLVWSEENDPTLGYDVAPYNNAWDNPGGYTEPLTALASMNDALYVFREARTIAITGAVNADFQTAGTRANISEVIGTASPWAVLELSQGVLFVDRTAAPHLAVFGAAEPVDLWRDCTRATTFTPRAALGNALAVRDAATETVLVGLPVTGGTTAAQWLCFADDDLQYCGTWSWTGTTDVVGAVVDGDGNGRIARGVGGSLYVHGLPTTGPLNDAGAAIAPRVTGPLQGYDMADELRVDMLEVSLPSCDATEIALGYETSRGAGGFQTISVPGTGGGFVLGVSTLGTGVLTGASTGNRQARVRTFGRGRGVQAIVQHTETNKSFAVDALRVRAYVTSGGVGRAP